MASKQEEMKFKYKEFANKNVILTGATGGIGIELLKELLQNKAKVCCLIHNEKNFPSYFEGYKNQDQLITIALDLTSPNQVTQAFKKGLTFLKGRLNHLIMCHGGFIYGGIEGVTVEDFDKIYNLNVRSNFHLLSISIPFLKLTKGNVVMISSVETKVVQKDDFLHSLSKTMINSMVQNAALELAEFGIRVNAVAPGFVNTQFRVSKWLSEENNAKYLEQMAGYQLLGDEIVEPRDIANSILFLASEESQFITGEILVVDNGYELNHDLSFKNQEGEEV